MASLRIFVADPQETVRQVLAALVSSQAEWEVCGQTGNGRDAVQQVAQLKPHLVVLALDLPGINGLEATRQIVQNDPGQNIIIVVPDNPDTRVREIYAAGARGYVRLHPGDTRPRKDAAALAGGGRPAAPPARRRRAAAPCQGGAAGQAALTGDGEPRGGVTDRRPTLR